MRFTALDFETATSSRNSACAIGLCVVDNGVVVEQRAWLIQPPGNEYADFNTNLHGIGPHDTINAPLFPQVFADAWELMAGAPLVAHNAAFDMSVIRSALDLYGLECPRADYYCTLVMSRLHWPALPSYSLPLVLARCGKSLRHHDPSEDADGAATVLLQIAHDINEESVEGVAQALRVHPGQLSECGYSPCGGPYGGSHRHYSKVSEIHVAADADPTNTFYDADVAFTGTLLSMTREQAMQQVAERGGRPRTSVGPKTEYLVVGSVEYHSLLTGEPSAKMRKAIELRAQRAPIEIISEQEFIEHL